MIVDYRKRRTEHNPILIDGAVVEQVESFKFLDVHITNKLEWSKHKQCSALDEEHVKGFAQGPNGKAMSSRCEHSSHPVATSIPAFFQSPSWAFKPAPFRLQVQLLSRWAT